MNNEHNINKKRVENKKLHKIFVLLPVSDTLKRSWGLCVFSGSLLEVTLFCGYIAN